MNDKPRCRWCNLANPLYVDYHDHEWGVPVHNDARLFEMLVLETFQAGLSWETVLNKRERFRAAFDGFDVERVRRYDDARIDALMEDPGIIRNRRKIAAAVRNAGVFHDIVAECGGFDAYLRRFTGGQVTVKVGATRFTLSDRLAADLKARGMAFVGSVTTYAYLQSIGVSTRTGRNATCTAPSGRRYRTRVPIRE